MHHSHKLAITASHCASKSPTVIAVSLSSRVNDWLLKINDVDLTNKDRKQAVKAVLNGGGLVNMVVRRRKSLGGRTVTPVHINLMGHKGTRTPTTATAPSTHTKMGSLNSNFVYIP